MKNSFFVCACAALLGTAFHACTGREQVQRDGWTLDLENALHRSASYLNVFDLKEAASAGEILNPDVRRLVEGLSEDDNGLVRIVDYR